MRQPILRTEPKLPRRWALTTLLAVPVLLLATSAGPAADALRIISPARAEIVSGPTRLEAQVEGLAGATVEFFVDGRSAGSVAAPPYRLMFDFGDSLRARRVRAVATTPDGASLAAEVSTRGVDLEGITEISRVDLVNLYITVRDQAGRIVEGVTEIQFKVFENGRAQQISHFSSERRSLVAALVIDASLTMSRDGKIEAARRAARRLLSSLEPGDRAMAVCFNEEVRLVMEPTEDLDAVADAIDRCEPFGGTALYDAVYRVAGKLSPIEGRKVTILLSDGRDEAASGLEPGSLHTLEEAVDRTLRSEVILFSVGIGKNLDAEKDFYERRTLQSILEELSISTGGRALFIRRAAGLDDAFDEISEELRHQYSLGYSSSNPRMDGTWRKLRVSIERPGLRAVTRTGYFAPRSSS